MMGAGPPPLTRPRPEANAAAAAHSRQTCPPSSLRRVQVWFLASEAVEAPFIVRLTFAFSPMILSPFELAPSGFLYLLSRGLVITGGDVCIRPQRT